MNAQLTSPFRRCCYEKRFHFCFVPANSTGNMNKTQANRTQTAAAGYMGECLSPYVCDSGGKRRDKTPLITASPHLRLGLRCQASNVFSGLRLLFFSSFFFKFTVHFTYHSLAFPCQRLFI